jgi:hypothetical protein
MKENSKLSSYYTNQSNLSQKKFYSILKPPFKKGLFSYKQTYNLNNNINSNNINNINNNNFFSYEPPNYSLINIKKEKNIPNLNQPLFPNDQGNSSFFNSRLNLNKYKINNINNNNNNNNKNDIQINNNENSDIIKNTNLSMNLNLYTKNNALNESYFFKEFFDYFKDARQYEKESRRMMVELIKLNINKKNNNINSIKQIIKEKNFSLKILNQKFNEKMEYDLNNNLNTINAKEVFGEAKKQVYLKNLDYKLSQNSTITTDILTSNNNRIFNIENYLIDKNNKKRINILNFLLTPRVLNLVEENNIKQKFIFFIFLDELFFSEGKESYIFQWKNMENDEIENEFNIKLIKKCEENKIFKNRFSLKVINNDLNDEEFNYEIETPSNEISNNYVIGINYLLNK